MIFESSPDCLNKIFKTDTYSDPSNSENTSDGDIWRDDGDEFKTTLDDDFYGERPAEPETAEIAALRRIHAKQGYLDGLSSKKEKSLQEGFDSGYPSGAEIGKQVGKILGTLQCLVALGQPEAKELIESAKQELHIRKVLSSKYFDDKLELQNRHVVIKEWEERVNKLVQNVKS